MSELNLTYSTFNQASGCNFAGLAIGCLLFIPYVHKFGRRPVYLLSAIVQFACAIWWANFHHAGELIAVSLLAGLAGSISEAIVMITIVDMFFVHQHARMNGIFLFMQSLGATGGPIAAGYVVVSMGWRWMWWLIAIFLGVNLILVLFFFEESKYVPVLVGRAGSSLVPQLTAAKSNDDDKPVEQPAHPVAPRSTLDGGHSRKPIRQRLAFVTKTDMPIVQHFYQPLFILFAFPAVAYAAITYGTLLAWFSAIASSGSYFLLAEPYNFSPSAIGLFHLGGFLGTFIATMTVPAFSDWFIVRSAKKNGGIFEPEMRLWMSIPGVLLNCAGLLIYGVGMGRVRCLPDFNSLSLSLIEKLTIYPGSALGCTRSRSRNLWVWFHLHCRCRPDVSD
jgi:MFS family permease